MRRGQCQLGSARSVQSQGLVERQRLATSDHADQRQRLGTGGHRDVVNRMHQDGDRLADLGRRPVGENRDLGTRIVRDDGHSEGCFQGRGDAIVRDRHGHLEFTQIALTSLPADATELVDRQAAGQRGGIQRVFQAVPIGIRGVDVRPAIPRLA